MKVKPTKKGKERFATTKDGKKIQLRRVRLGESVEDEDKLYQAIGDISDAIINLNKDKKQVGKNIDSAENKLDSVKDNVNSTKEESLMEDDDLHQKMRQFHGSTFDDFNDKYDRENGIHKDDEYNKKEWIIKYTIGYNPKDTISTIPTSEDADTFTYHELKKFVDDQMWKVQKERKSDPTARMFVESPDKKPLS